MWWVEKGRNFKDQLKSQLEIPDHKMSIYKDISCKNYEEWLSVVTGLLYLQEKNPLRHFTREINKKSDFAFYGKPFYGKTVTDVVVQEGSHAFLHCVVHNLGNQTVSWVRNLDSHILFIGKDRFVHEDRYDLIPSRHGRWTLKINFVGARDAGKYECQVSVVPKLSQIFSLNIVVPSVKILGDEEVHVKSGSSVTLTCLISNCLEEPAYVFWYHEGRRIMNGLNIKIDTKRIIGDGSAVSTITVFNSDKTYEGIYTCRPAHLDPSSVSLHVIQAEKPAAMQRETSITSSAGTSGSSVPTSIEATKTRAVSSSFSSRITHNSIFLVILLFVGLSFYFIQ
ncbi:unnamed protein product [Lepeophtheirus salmonis]|uniref:(salmon louse) hypothetical protein n=2 Tax=Lepeophtheirus salmonis TaxID=72036 RepID=A0A7R8CS00_LEPSM|nr:unnamed protein product [Lepeophtheirus salmonis]CAF2909962.1 unnamed protein product [Lepeophtheirus salmonis]